MKRAIGFFISPSSKFRTVGRRDLTTLHIAPHQVSYILYYTTIYALLRVCAVVHIIVIPTIYVYRSFASCNFDDDNKID